MPTGITEKMGGLKVFLHGAKNGDYLIIWRGILLMMEDTNAITGDGCVVSKRES